MTSVNFTLPVSFAAGGPYQITVIASGISSAQFPLPNSPNHAPVGTSSTVTDPENAAYTITTANFGFSDPNDTPSNNFLGAKIDSFSGPGTLTDNGNAVTGGQFVSAADIAAGLLVFTPNTVVAGNLYALMTFQVEDDGGTVRGGSNIDPVTRTLTINQTPALANIESSSLVYPGTGTSAVTATLTAMNEEQTTLTTASIQLTSGYQNGSDSLVFTNTTNITGTWNAGTGTLVLTGVDTAANYQTALRSVQFETTSSNTTTRTISFQVADGSITSNIVTRTVHFLANAPVVQTLVPTGVSPATGTIVQFGLTFSEPVTGVAAADFTLVDSGMTGGVITVSGSGASYTLTVHDFVGQGTMGVNLTTFSSIVDANQNVVVAGFTGGVATAVIPSLGPTVTSVLNGSSVVPAGGKLVVSINQLSVVFSDDLNATIGGTNSVVNTANWQLLLNGVDVSSHISGI